MRIAIPTPDPAANANQQIRPVDPWMILPGDYRAVLKQVKPTCQKVRWVFSVIVPGYAAPFLAGKNYVDDLSSGTALRNDLFSWRGHDLTQGEIQAGAIDTNHFVGKLADIRIVHIENADFAKPFVSIKAIYPPGTLIGIRNDLN